MPDFNVRSDAVNVEQVMEQIRARIREKRGVDYTEQQIRELAAVKLEKFLDPRGVRSDLLAEFRKAQLPHEPSTVPLYAFEDTTLFDSRRPVVRFIRRLLRPLLKLVFNVNALSQSLHQQVEINRRSEERFERLRQAGDLYYELLHNLVVELTRATIEVKNMKMRVESIASRLEFNERRARALESVVVYKPSGDEGRRDRQDVRRPDSAGPASAAPSGAAAPQTGGAQAATPAAQAPQPPGAPEGPGQRSRRRRRRRGRRGGPPAAAMMGGADAGATPPPADAAGEAPSGPAASASPPEASEPASDASDDDQ